MTEVGRLHSRYTRSSLLVLALLVLAAPAVALAPPALDADDACTLDAPAREHVPLANPHCPGIRPGLQMTAPSGCTFNFVFEDADGALYIGTAGHCVDRVGQRVTGEGVGAFGTVTYRIDEGQGSDFALIAIDPARYAEVTPVLCAWGGPVTGEPAAPAFGDAMRQYGHGVGFGYAPVVEEQGAPGAMVDDAQENTRPREGVLVAWTDTTWKAVLPVSGGDSGSPAIFATGEAAGVVTHLSAGFAFGTNNPGGVEVTTAAGTRLARAVALAEAGTGLDLALVTSA